MSALPELQPEPAEIFTVRERPPTVSAPTSHARSHEEDGERARGPHAARRVGRRRPARGRCRRAGNPVPAAAPAFGGTVPRRYGGHEVNTDGGAARSGRRPFPIVLPSETERTKLTLQREGLDVLRGIKGPIAPVVVIGPYRSGKSFLLNQMLGVSCGRASAWVTRARRRPRACGFGASR